MGVFGTGLYSGDFALDLRSMIRAVSRLPYDGERLVDIICEAEPDAAENPENEDHTTFWLVVADQFAKRGIESLKVRSKAIGIIDGGTDLAMLEKLGMVQSDLGKRKKMLEDLRAHLLAPIAAKSRPTIKKPQPFLMDLGDVLIYPTCGGRNVNPYFGSKESQPKMQGSLSWHQDGWGAITILDRGRAFGFLAWYRPLTMVSAVPERPTIESVQKEILWRLETPGTCSAIHFRRIEFEKIGAFHIDDTRLRSEFPNLRPGVSAAVNGISIANRLAAAPSYQGRFLALPGEPLNVGRTPTIRGLERILQVDGS